METNIVGFRFYPTDEELINDFLKNKILGKSWLVDDTIREINICSYVPASLPSLSKIKSEDLVWYFFSPKEYTTAKKNVTKRTTPSGFWKLTGKDRKIKDKRGKGVVIGIKKTLVYHEGRASNAVWTPWTMHEYHITCLPLLNQTYVICKLIYKGDVGDIPSGSGSNSSPSLVFDDSNTVGEITPRLQVEQPGEESLYDLSVTMIMNEQEDLCPWDVLYSNTFSDNNDIPNVQVQAAYVAQDDDEFMGSLTKYMRD